MSETTEKKADTGKVLTNDASLPEDAPKKRVRFESAGLDSVDGYENCRIRRWEVYQRTTIKAGLLNRLKVSSLADYDAAAAADPEKVAGVVSNWLQTCLVGAQMKAAAKLIRPGASGLKKLQEELTDDQVIATFRKAMELSEVFEAA